jgi:hypothetical protein
MAIRIPRDAVRRCMIDQPCNGHGLDEGRHHLDPGQHLEDKRVPRFNETPSATTLFCPRLSLD